MEYFAIGSAAYLLCSWAAYRILMSDLKKTFSEITRGDRRFSMAVSIAGPASLLAAIIIWLSGRDWGGDEVIWRADDR
jgi:hypothetical protein